MCSGASSGGASIADANGCNSSGLENAVTSAPRQPRSDARTGKRRHTMFHHTPTPWPRTGCKNGARTTRPMRAGCRGQRRRCRSWASTSTSSTSPSPSPSPSISVSTGRAYAPNVFFALGDDERVRFGTEVDRAAGTADFAADRTRTELPVAGVDTTERPVRTSKTYLVRDGGVALHSKADGPAMTAALQQNRHIHETQQRGFCSDTLAQPRMSSKIKTGRCMQKEFIYCTVEIEHGVILDDLSNNEQ